VDELDTILGAPGNIDPEMLWHLRLLKAEILVWQGNNRDALLLLKSPGVAEPTSTITLARKNVLLGVIETGLQQLDLADQTFRAVERTPEATSPDVLGDLLMGEGKLAAFRRDPARSEILLRRALQVSQSNGQIFLVSRALGNLGALEMQRNHYADAVDLFNQALTAAERLNAQTTILRTTVNLGAAYRRMGDFDRASELFEKSEKSAAQLGMTSDQTRAVTNLGMIEHIEHRFAAAEKSYQQALQLARRADDQQDTIFCLTDLAQVAIQQGSLDQAELFNNEALRMEQSSGDHATELASLFNEADIALRRKDADKAEELLGRVVRDRSADVFVKASALTLQANIDQQRDHMAAAETHFKAAIASLEEERKSLGRDELQLSYPTNSKDFYDNYIDFLVSHQKQNEAFRVSELRRARTLTDGLGMNAASSRPFDVTEAQHAAARLGHPILSYWIGTRASYLWVVLPTQTQLFTLPPEGTIRPLVERYRAHLLGPLGGDSLANADGRQLYKILIGPAEHWIKPQSGVTIISDGPLCGLNFETLPVASAQPHYWIEDVSITNASSAVLLAFGNHTNRPQLPTRAKNLLLIGNPQSPPNYPPLNHAGEEIRLVGQHFGKDQETVLSGAQATPAAYFKAQPEKYSLIHFVAHGTASRISPLDSAVVLSLDGSSYNLYARDIAASRLHANLVTISSCDSAGARIYSSEGLVGLSWAFLRAGAERVIASLWVVNDAFTPRLMDQLYSSIAQGDDPAAALRNAKLTLLRSKGIYSRPFYWAPFVLYQGV
jgi:CHAT domain-containing protein/tetratricopeptide (TPR) repeat protein